MRERSPEKLVITARATVLDAIDVIEHGGARVAFVTSSEEALIGVVTDGDVRRHLLLGGATSDEISVAMNMAPVVAKPSDRARDVALLMKCAGIRQVPVVGNSRKVRSVFFTDA
jgi:CBS domain-containing protein